VPASYYLMSNLKKPSLVIVGVSQRDILGAFEKLRKATISFVMSVRPRGMTRVPLDGFP